MAANVTNEHNIDASSKDEKLIASQDATSINEHGDIAILKGKGVITSGTVNANKDGIAKASKDEDSKREEGEILSGDSELEDNDKPEDSECEEGEILSGDSELEDNDKLANTDQIMALAPMAASMKNDKFFSDDSESDPELNDRPVETETKMPATLPSFKKRPTGQGNQPNHGVSTAAKCCRTQLQLLNNSLASTPTPSMKITKATRPPKQRSRAAATPAASPTIPFKTRPHGLPRAPVPADRALSGDSGVWQFSVDPCIVANGEGKWVRCHDDMCPLTVSSPLGILTEHFTYLTASRLNITNLASKIRPRTISRILKLTCSSARNTETGGRSGETRGCRETQKDFLQANMKSRQERSLAVDKYFIFY